MYEKKKWVLFSIIFVNLYYIHSILCDYNTNDGQKWPTVIMCILARNKAHTLPYFLSSLEKLDYPKDRISLWIRSDHNRDKTVDILKTWFKTVEKSYHNIDLKYVDNGPISIAGETGPTHWPKTRFEYVISLRTECLDNSRRIWADYLLMLDADVFLTDEITLKDLVLKNFDLVAPMLHSEGLYSNFWYGMSKEYYYMRTEQYLPTLYREQVGCFAVPMIHSAVLINLRKTLTDTLTYNPHDLEDYKGPYDDIIAFAVSANISGIPLHVCNSRQYGYIMTPLEQNDSLEMDDVTNLKLQSLADDSFIEALPKFDNFISYSTPDKMGFDEIYMINLQRRPDRRQKMERSFKELSLNATAVNAVDGRELDATALEKLGISFLPNYEDPYHNRPMTFGEIGCFLSHYNIWKEVENKGYEKVMVLEDDIRFESHFRRKLNAIMKDIQDKKIYWDLIYIGRKRLQGVEETPVGHALVKASYSYWTLGYLLSQNGARKLVDSKPLLKLLPVDEYLPIMFNSHPNSAWSEHYSKRDLVALSVDPLLVYPTHYTGEAGYVSDTEASPHINEL